MCCGETKENWKPFQLGAVSARKSLLDLTQKTLGAFGYLEPNSVTLHHRQAISFWPPTRGPGRALADYAAV